MLTVERAAVLADVLRCARAGLSGTWLRGRRFPRGARPSRAEFSDGERRDEGRFHRADEEALYFARTVDAVRAECPPEEGRPDLWVLRYDLDLPDARVLDRPLPAWPRATALSGIWAKADEMASATEDYALTQWLADVARSCGVDALRYRSDEAADEGPVNLVVWGEAARRVAGMAIGEPQPG